jgi:hypothetical protein
MAIKYWILAVCISLVSSEAWAQGPKRSPRDPNQRKQMVEKFDKDGDGKLNKEEKTAAREAMRAHRVGGGQRVKGRRGGTGGESQQRGQRGQSSRGGSKNFMADPGAMFDQIDSDGDGNVTKEQFVKFMEKMRAQFGQRGDGSQRGKRGKSGKRGDSGRQTRPPR